MFTLFQIVALTVLMFFNQYGQAHTQIFVYGRKVLGGWLAGLIMGDPVTGLMIGGTMELMSLGVAGYGGSSVPNYNIGVVIGVAFAVAAGGGMDAGLAVGIPVAALGVQLDVFGKMAGSFFLHKAQAASKTGDLKGVYRWIFMGLFPRPGFAALTVLIALTAGSTLIQTLLDMMPVWLSSGLNIAGGILPAVGFAILLRYMPIKKYFVYGMLGFVLASYFKIPMIGIAIIGFIAAYLVYSQNERFSKYEGVNVLDKGDSYDE